MAFETIAVETEDHVTTIRLNRPDVMNALSLELLGELSRALDEASADDKVRCIILTGSERAFAAGADIKEMSNRTFVQALTEDLYTTETEAILKCRKPIIAAVAGYALGGGCELAMTCDFIIAADTAKFGQPEINLGVIPGFGGTQRLARRIGLPLARELIYSGDMIDAEAAVRYGLANRVVPVAECVNEAKALAHKLATKPPIAIQQAKAAINAGIDMDIVNGCRFETEAFGLTFATQDKAEGMAAFLEKRAAKFSGK
jgi:enoyl-CoA hydratase